MSTTANARAEDVIQSSGTRSRYKITQRSLVQPCKLLKCGSEKVGTRAGRPFDQLQWTGAVPFTLGPENRTTSPLQIVTHAILFQPSVTVRIAKFPAQRGRMIERRCYEASPTVAHTPSQYTPVLVMTIRVADQRIQNQVISKAELGLSCSLSRWKNPLHHAPDVGQRVTRLIECLPGIVPANNALQHLVAVDQFPAAARKGLCSRSSLALKLRQFYLRMEHPQTRRYLGGNLLGPMLSGVVLRVFEEPSRLFLRIVVPKLFLAPHLFRPKHPFRRYFNDGIGFWHRYPNAATVWSKVLTGVHGLRGPSRDPICLRPKHGDHITRHSRRPVIG